MRLSWNAHIILNVDVREVLGNGYLSSRVFFIKRLTKIALNLFLFSSLPLFCKVDGMGGGGVTYSFTCGSAH